MAGEPGSARANTGRNDTDTAMAIQNNPIDPRELDGKDQPIDTEMAAVTDRKLVVVDKPVDTQLVVKDKVVNTENAAVEENKA
jgi:hypothetical protein